MAKITDYIKLLIIYLYIAMRWLYMKTIFLLVKRWKQYLLERQVKKALRLTKLTGRVHIVTWFYGKAVCWEKKSLKEAIARRTLKLKKGQTIESVERLAYFITTPGKFQKPPDVYRETHKIRK